jgi:hypothetical protein
MHYNACAPYSPYLSERTRPNQLRILPRTARFTYVACTWGHDNMEPGCGFAHEIAHGLREDCVGPGAILNVRDCNKPQLRLRIKSKAQKQHKRIDSQLVRALQPLCILKWMLGCTCAVKHPVVYDTVTVIGHFCPEDGGRLFLRNVGDRGLI